TGHHGTSPTGGWSDPYDGGEGRPPSHGLEGPRMGCLAAITSGAIPRLITLFYWIARPTAWDAAFGGPVIPILGIVFLPFTTLMYVVLFTRGQGLSGLDIVVLLLAVLIDVFNWGAAAYSNKNRIGFKSTAD